MLSLRLNHYKKAMDADFLAVVREEELVLLLGSNLGDKRENLSLAIAKLEAQLGKVSHISKVYDTAPWGKTNQDSFVNQAVIIPCRIKPMIVLEIILNIEQKLGRVRYEKWGPRLIDIDIIFYGKQIYHSDLLEIPHPYMQDRKFVLEPLNEIIPQFEHPLMNQTVAELHEILKASDDE